MKKLTMIRNEKPYYYVSIIGVILFESESLKECKQYLINYLKKHKNEIEEEQDYYLYFIGMYNISVED